MLRQNSGGRVKMFERSIYSSHGSEKQPADDVEVGDIVRRFLTVKSGKGKSQHRIWEGNE